MISGFLDVSRPHVHDWHHGSIDAIKIKRKRFRINAQRTQGASKDQRASFRLRYVYHPLPSIPNHENKRFFGPSHNEIEKLLVQDEEE